MRKTIIFLIKLYRLILSPVLGNNCKFHPTCSQYAIDTLKTYPFHTSIIKILYRIIRCNPWNKGGYDPVKLKES